MQLFKPQRYFLVLSLRSALLFETGTLLTNLRCCLYLSGPHYPVSHALMPVLAMLSSRWSGTTRKIGLEEVSRSVQNHTIVTHALQLEYKQARPPLHIFSLRPTCLPNPLMIPALFPRSLRLTPSILDRHPLPDSLLLHRNPEQPSGILASHHAILANDPQRLARVSHAIVLPFQVSFLRLKLLAPVEEVSSMNGPVA